LVGLARFRLAVTLVGRRWAGQVGAATGVLHHREPEWAPRAAGDPGPVGELPIVVGALRDARLASRACVRARHVEEHGNEPVVGLL
jgi:hypothetical protein